MDLKQNLLKKDPWENIFSNINIMKFSCSQCEKCYGSKMSLSNHKRLNHGHPKLYPCTLCQYTSKMRQVCEMHIRAVHEK